MGAKGLTIEVTQIVPCSYLMGNINMKRTGNTILKYDNGANPIHIKHQAVRTAEQCTSAFFSEAHAECSGLVGRQPTTLNIYEQISYFQVS